MRTRSLKMAILIHMLSNVFYTVVSDGLGNLAKGGEALIL